MSDTRDRIGQVQIAEEELIAALRSPDAANRETALIKFVIRMSRSLDAISTSLSELHTAYGELRKDVRELHDDLRIVAEAEPKQPTLITVLRLIKWPVSVPLTALIIFIGMRPQIAGAIARFINAFVGGGQ